MDEALHRAEILMEALPYIRRFHGQTVVVKVGGNAIEQRKEETLLDVVLLRYVGMLPVLVHGGGPEITAMSERLGLASQFKDGLRITDEPTMEAVEGDPDDGPGPGRTGRDLPRHPTRFQPADLRLRRTDGIPGIRTAHALLLAQTAQL